MNVIPTALDGVLIIEPDVFADARGFFMESWNARRYRERGIDVDVVQDNLSFSRKGVLRGLHFQNPSPQGKLVSVLAGEVFDVAVDIRVGAPTFGAWTSVILSSENNRQFYVPEGFAHGFVVLSDEALVNYKCTALYDGDADGGIRWNDPALNIAWPVEAPILSPKDAQAPFLHEVPAERLFTYQPVGTV